MMKYMHAFFLVTLGFGIVCASGRVLLEELGPAAASSTEESGATSEALVPQVATETSASDAEAAAEEFSADPKAAMPPATQAAGVDSDVNPSGVVPDAEVVCMTKPHDVPRGYTRQNWTAVWPDRCEGTEVYRPCYAECKPGFRLDGSGFRPKVYCGPPKPDDRFGSWSKILHGGACVPIPKPPLLCAEPPPAFNYATWPGNCSNVSPNTSCVGQCNNGSAPDPVVPSAVCVGVSTPRVYTAVWMVSNITQTGCKYVGGTSYMGCFVEPWCGPQEQRALMFLGASTRMTPEKCFYLAAAKGFQYAAVQLANECYGGNNLTLYRQVPENRCMHTCPGDNSKLCGGVCANSIWRIDPTGSYPLDPCLFRPCDDIEYAVQDSCVTTYGDKDFTCVCYDNYRWNAESKTCNAAKLMALAVAYPAEGPPKSYIYKYNAKKTSHIGNARWEVQDNGTTDLNLYAVSIADSSTAYAVGAQGLMKKYDGVTWSVVHAGDTDTPDLFAVAAVGPNRAWAGGAGGSAWYFDGKQWVSVAIDKAHTIHAIAATPDPRATTWAVAADDANPNHLWSYIYKWKFTTKQWELHQTFEDITLRGVTALDEHAAWACGYSVHERNVARAVVLRFDAAAGNWTREGFTVDDKGSLGRPHLNAIVAIHYEKLYAVGYIEVASNAGTETSGLILEGNGHGSWGVRYIGFPSEGNGMVYSFDAVAGLSPSTTVAVGYYVDQAVAWGWGYPAENWQKYSFNDRPMASNTSVAKDLAFSGVAMKYVDV